MKRPRFPLFSLLLLALTLGLALTRGSDRQAPPLPAATPGHSAFMPGDAHAPTPGSASPHHRGPSIPGLAPRPGTDPHDPRHPDPHSPSAQRGIIYDGTFNHELQALPRFNILYWANILARDDHSLQRTIEAARISQNGGGVFSIDSRQLDREAWLNPKVHPDPATLALHIRQALAYVDWVERVTGTAPQLYGTLSVRGWFNDLTKGPDAYRSAAIAPILAITDEQGRTLFDRVPALEAVNYFADSWYDNWDRRGYEQARRVGLSLVQIARELDKPLFIYLSAQSYREPGHLIQHARFLQSQGVNVVIWQGPEPVPDKIKAAILRELARP